jgi:Glycosyl transferases group 1
LYKIPLQKIAIIHHGVPDFAAIQKTPARFSYPGKKVLSTFGLLGRSKGIETVINALPDVVKEHPDIVYVVLGQTHPNVKLYCGEEYRDFLKALAAENGVQDHVVFEDSFVDEEDLKNFLLNTDIYITPYLNEGQITSGTVSYAVGAGACIVSTPFWHAKELLEAGRGRLFGFGNSDALAKELNDLLKNPEEIKNTGNRAFEYGKKMYWNKVGFRYNKLLEKTSIDYTQYNNEKRIKPQLPKFNLEHVRRLTDNTGIAEHANYSIPDYREGYCLDDNARALLLVLLANEAGLDQNSNDLVNTYLQYIRLMQKDDGRFHNDFSFEKKFADETGSEDSFGRTVWAMGVLIRLASNDSHFQFAKDVFFRALPHFENLKSIRAIANTVIGISNFLSRYPDNEKMIHILTVLTAKLTAQYVNETTDTWKWFEPVLCYDNAILPLALWHSFMVTKNKKVKNIAVETTDFLRQESVVNGHISLVGNTWYYKGNEKPANGQQPINAMALVMMYQKAWQATKDEIYYRQMHKSFSWFLGNNDLGIPLFDEETNGCCDGLDLSCVNRNQGAESTISYHLAYTVVYMAEQEVSTLLPQETHLPAGSSPNKLIPFSKNETAKITAN